MFNHHHTTPISRPAVMENLEGRQMFAASAFDTIAMIGPMIETSHTPAAIEHSLAHDSAAPGAKAKKIKGAKSNGKSKPTLAGKWSGVAIIDKGNITVDMTAKLKNGSNHFVSGKVKMAAVMGHKPLKSNLIIDPYNNCRMVLSGNGSVGGLTAAASPDGKSIVGRWTWNVKGLWVTGTFKLTKVS